jgi:hypothetical protein
MKTSNLDKRHPAPDNNVTDGVEAGDVSSTRNRAIASDRSYVGDTEKMSLNKSCLGRH